MKFMKKTFFKKALLVAAFLLFIGQLFFADAGPGPAPVDFTVDLMKEGKPYVGEAEMAYLCSNATERGLSRGVEPGDVALKCTAGKCINEEWYYKFNPCFYSKGRLEAKVEGQTVTSEEVSLESGGSYSFNFDVETGEIKQTNYSPPCLPIGLLVLAFAAALFAKAKVSECR